MNNKKHYELARIQTPVEDTAEREPNRLEPTDLIHYLFNLEITHGEILPNSFDFSPHSHYLKELYDFSKKDFIYNQETRDKHSTLREMSDLLSQQHQVEAGRTLYLDIDAEKIGATDIDSGTVTKVELQFFELYQERKMPGLLMHTHPSSQMPSAEDYIPLLKDYLENGVRLLKGIIVLCPEIQVLALATGNTPLLYSEKIDAMVAANHKLIMDFYDRAGVILEKVIKKSVTKPFDLFEKYLHNISALLDQVNEGAMTMEEFEEKSAALRLEHDAKDKEADKDDPNAIFDKSVKRLKPILNRFGNAALVSFARDVRLKLYSSDDMANFKEFSA